MITIPPSCSSRHLSPSRLRVPAIVISISTSPSSHCRHFPAVVHHRRSGIALLKSSSRRRASSSPSLSSLPSLCHASDVTHRCRLPASHHCHHSDVRPDTTAPSSSRRHLVIVVVISSFHRLSMIDVVAPPLTLP